MVQLVPDDSDEIPHGLVVILSIVAHFSYLHPFMLTNVKWNSFIQGVLMTLYSRAWLSSLRTLLSSI